jgi:hypothetical protein
MRFSTYALIAAMTVLLGTGCSGKNSNNQNANSSGDASTTAAASAPADQSAASPAPEISATAADGSTSGSSDAAGDIPTYPGATVQASGTSTMAGGGQQATGKVLSTGDSFNDVYHWYQKNLPAGSEKVHVTAPVETASFILSATGKNQTSVTITTNSGKRSFRSRKSPSRRLTRLPLAAIATDPVDAPSVSARNRRIVELTGIDAEGQQHVTRRLGHLGFPTFDLR